MSVPVVNLPPVRILSFDPGTTNMGWALSEYDPMTGQFNVHSYGVFKSTKVAKKRKEEVECFGQRMIALRVVFEETSKLMQQYQPNFVVTEDTFFNPGTPQAHIALLLCIHAIEHMLYTTYHDQRLVHATAKKIYKLAPSTIKMILSGHGMSIKAKMMDALMSANEIQFVNKSKEELEGLLIEHEVDAIAVGYTFAKTELISILVN